VFKGVSVRPSAGRCDSPVSEKSLILDDSAAGLATAVIGTAGNDDGPPRGIIGREILAELLSGVCPLTMAGCKAPRPLASAGAWGVGALGGGLRSGGKLAGVDNDSAKSSESGIALMSAYEVFPELVPLSDKNSRSPDDKSRGL
jgi:hypothetical protein